jgi:hypothetical protein
MTNEYSGIADQKALYDDLKLLPNKWFALRKNDKWCIRDVVRNQQTEFEFVDVKVEGKKIFTAKKIFGRKKWKEFNP